MYPTEGHNKWVNQSLNNSGWRRHFQVNWFNSLPKAQLTSTLHSVLKFKHTIFFSSPLTTHLQNYVAPSFFSQPALPSGPHVHHLMSPAGKAATNLQSPKCSGAAAPNVNPLFASLSTCSLEWFLLHSKASWERLDPARLPHQRWWLTSCMETALPSSSSDPQASRRPNTSIHSCQCPAQCDPTTWSWRQTFLPICAVLAQKCNRHCFLSQHAGGGGGKMAFLFYSPRNQENPSWTYGAHDFGEGESLNTLLIPWCQRDCQILPVPIHTSCIFYLTFFFFWTWNCLYEVLTGLTASCVFQSFPAQARKNNKKRKQNITLWLTKEQFVCNSAQWFGQLIKLLCQSKTFKTLTFCSAKSREGSWLTFWQPSLRNWKNCLVEIEFNSEGW